MDRFALLGGIGGKMLWEARSSGEERARPEGDPFAPRVLLVLALDTSVDTLAVGIAFPTLGAPLATSVATIGVVTAALSAAGLWLGHRASARLGRKLDALEGLVLLGLGMKILAEHLRRG